MRGTILLLAAACHDEPAYEISEAEAQRYAELRCRATEQCCGEPEAGCVERWRTTVLDWRDAGEGDLTFSEQCMADALAWMETLACEEETAPPCKLASGSLRLGDACVNFGDLGVYGTDCAEGFQCSGVCVDDPLVTSQAPPGGFCDGVAWTCEPEYYCSDEAICEPQVGLGQPCWDTLECLLLASNYCAGVQSDAPGRCMPRLELGAACVAGEDECGSVCDGSSCIRLECIDGTCAVPVRGPAVCQ